MECRCGFTCGTQAALDKHCATCPVVDGREAPPQPARIASPSKWTAAKEDFSRDSRDEWSAIKHSSVAERQHVVTERYSPKSAGAAYRERDRGQRAFGEIVLEVPDQTGVMDHIDTQLSRISEMVSTQRSTLDHIQRYMPQLDQGMSLSALVAQCMSAACEDMRQELRRGFQEQRNELQAVRSEICQHEVSLQDAVSRISRKVEGIKSDIDHAPLLHAINKLDFTVDHGPVLQAVKGLHGHHSNLLDAHSEIMEKVNYLHDMHSKLHQSHGEVLSRVNGLHDHHDKLAESHNTMYEKLAGIHDHHSRLHGSHAEMMARVDALHDHHSRLVDTHSSILDRVNGLHEHHSTVLDRVDGLHDHHNSVLDRMKGIHDHHNHVLEKVNGLHDHHTHVLDKVNGLHDHHSRMWDHHAEVKDKLYEIDSRAASKSEPGVYHTDVLEAVNNIHSHHSKMLDAVTNLDLNVDHSVVLSAIDRLADAIGAERIVSDQSGVLWAIDRLKAEVLDAISKIELNRREASPVVVLRDTQPVQSVVVREQPVLVKEQVRVSPPVLVAGNAPAVASSGAPCTVQRTGIHMQGRETSPMPCPREPVAYLSPTAGVGPSTTMFEAALPATSFESTTTVMPSDQGMRRGLSPSPSQRTFLMQQGIPNSGLRPLPEIQGYSPAKRMGSSPSGYP